MKELRDSYSLRANSKNTKKTYDKLYEQILHKLEILNITLFNMLHTVLIPSLSLILLQYL